MNFVENYPDFQNKYSEIIFLANRPIVFITVSCVSSTDRLIQFSISLKALHSVRAFKAVFSKLFNCVTKQQILQPANISVSDEHFLPFLTTEDHDTAGKGGNYCDTFL